MCTFRDQVVRSAIAAESGGNAPGSRASSGRECMPTTRNRYCQGKNEPKPCCACFRSRTARGGRTPHNFGVVVSMVSIPWQRPLFSRWVGRVSPREAAAGQPTYRAPDCLLPPSPFPIQLTLVHFLRQRETAKSAVTAIDQPTIGAVHRVLQSTTTCAGGVASAPDRARHGGNADINRLESALPKLDDNACDRRGHGWGVSSVSCIRRLRTSPKPRRFVYEVYFFKSVRFPPSPREGYGLLLEAACDHLVVLYSSGGLCIASFNSGASLPAVAATACLTTSLKRFLISKRGRTPEISGTTIAGRREKAKKHKAQVDISLGDATDVPAWLFPSSHRRRRHRRCSTGQPAPRSSSSLSS